jgi:hypothetical protein
VVGSVVDNRGIPQGGDCFFQRWSTEKLSEESKMATWKKFTDLNDDRVVQVNLDQVAFMKEEDGRTELYFATPSGDRVLRLGVKESLKDMDVDKMFDSLRRG